MGDAPDLDDESLGEVVLSSRLVEEVEEDGRGRGGAVPSGNPQRDHASERVLARIIGS
jgi:hypothetical protein